MSLISGNVIDVKKSFKDKIRRKKIINRDKHFDSINFHSKRMTFYTFFADITVDENIIPKA